MLTRAAVRSFSTQALPVVNNVVNQRFTVSLHGEDAVIEYKQLGNTITFLHTEVPGIFQGKGVGKLLAESAFQHAEKENLNVICKCNFLSTFFEKNHEKYTNLEVKIVPEV